MSRPGRLWIGGLVAAGLALSLGHLHLGGGGALRPGTPAPALRLEDRAGSALDLAGFRGHVVVLNFWATWCAPCVAELPSLDRLDRALGRDGLVVLAVCVDERAALARRFVDERRLGLRVLFDRGGAAAMSTFHVEGYPTTFVIDATGRILERHEGTADWDLPEALDHFRGLMSAVTAPTR